MNPFISCYFIIILVAYVCDVILCDVIKFPKFRGSNDPIWSQLSDWNAMFLITLILEGRDLIKRFLRVFFLLNVIGFGVLLKIVMSLMKTNLGRQNLLFRCRFRILKAV